MLDIHDLQKKFGKRQALKDVSFSLAAGEIYGLLGPNGAGKTTTLKILAGLLASDGGSITIDGKPYHREQHELKKLIAYVPDQPFLYYKLSGEEHLNFYQDLYKIPYAKRKEKIDFFFKYFEFEEYRTELVENYSAGTRQKLLIVGALVAVFVINMKMIPLPHPSVKNFVSYLNLVMALFIVAGLNSRFTFTSIPGEGPGLAHIFSSPLVKEKFYHFKLWFHLVPLLLIGFALYAVGDLALHFDAFTRVIALVFLTPAIVFLTILSLVLGIETNETNPLSPEHVIVSKQGISYMLWSMIYLVAGMIFLIRPVGIYYWHHFTHAAIPYREILAWFLGFELVNLALITFYYRRGKKLWLAREL